MRRKRKESTGETYTIEEWLGILDGADEQDEEDRIQCLGLAVDRMVEVLRSDAETPLPPRLPKFNGLCVKCGHDEMAVRYVPEPWAQVQPATPISLSTVSLRTQPEATWPQARHLPHLVTRCHRCGVVMPMRALDTKDAELSDASSRRRRIEYDLGPEYLAVLVEEGICP